MRILEGYGQSEVLTLAWKLRKKVFIQEQKVPEEIERDEVDFYAWHIVLLDESNPLATGRLFKIDSGTYSIGRVAVEKGHRGRGFGKQIMRGLLLKAWALDAKRVELHSQVHAKDFYEALGFEVRGETYLEAGIEHVTMIISNNHNDEGLPE